MLHTKGIVFRTVKFKESSLIIDLYTEEKGLHSFFMNSVFNSKTSRLSSLFQIGNLVELVAYYSEKKDLHRIKEVNPDYLYTSIPNTIFKSAISTFIIELCRHSIKDQQGNAELFQFIRRCLILLDRQEVVDANFHLKFMIRLCNFLGLQPQNNFSEINNSFDLLNAVFVPYELKDSHCILPDQSEQLSKLMQDAYSSEKTLEVNYEDRNKLLNILLQYYKIHVDHFGELKSPGVYKSIL
ncbi:MAG: DNA repair protein RecO [Saprospiraceae bacterium]